MKETDIPNSINNFNKKDFTSISVKIEDNQVTWAGRLLAVILPSSKLYVSASNIATNQLSK